MLVTAAVGIALGLLVSALVRTSEMATSLVPLILIPQILFAGLVGVPAGVSKVASMLMPAAYAFDTMKRFSGLDTLEPEGAKPNGRTKGRGLYRSIDAENEEMIEKFKAEVEEYKRAARDFQNDPVSKPMPKEPELPAAKKIPENLSAYVTFLHPWMNEFVNQFVLMLMFGLLVIVTLIVLRLQDLI
jgi:ABC transport system ATP-binding/permease protein